MCPLLVLLPLVLLTESVAAREVGQAGFGTTRERFVVVGGPAGAVPKEEEVAKSLPLFCFKADGCMSDRAMLSDALSVRCTVHVPGVCGVVTFAGVGGTATTAAATVAFA